MPARTCQVEVGAACSTRMVRSSSSRALPTPPHSRPTKTRAYPTSEPANQPGRVSTTGRGSTTPPSSWGAPTWVALKRSTPRSSESRMFFSRSAIALYVTTSTTTSPRARAWSKPAGRVTMATTSPESSIRSACTGSRVSTRRYSGSPSRLVSAASNRTTAGASGSAATRATGRSRPVGVKIHEASASSTRGAATDKTISLRVRPATRRFLIQTLIMTGSQPGTGGAGRSRPPAPRSPTRAL